MDPNPPPKLRFALNLWTLVGHPSGVNEWTLDEKLHAVKAAGFDAVNSFALPAITSRLPGLGLGFAGGFNFPQEHEFEALIRAQMAAGAETINVQLGGHDTPVAEAVRLVLLLMAEAQRQGAGVHLEIHRGTCTETPEKAYAIADAYHQSTGKLLRMNHDFSHLAVVKHLMPEEFSKRLLVRRDLVQNANLIHCRPFNGHHCQVPVTDGRGGLTREFLDYLPFVEDVFRCWLEGSRPQHQLWVVPELGPVDSGYGISTWPAPWEDALVLKAELLKVWRRAILKP